jgi:hypothetical protein
MQQCRGSVSFDIVGILNGALNKHLMLGRASIRWLCSFEKPEALANLNDAPSGKNLPDLFQN